MEKLVGEFLIFLATIDPVSTLLIFVALTGALPPKDRRRIAWRAIGYSAGILVGFIVLGELFLSSIGIRLAAFQLAGGIIFFLFGFQMVFGRGPGYRDSSPEPGHDVAVFPLAVPSIASPGAILAAVVLTDNRQFSLSEQFVTTLLMLAVLAITLVLMLQANRIHALIGIGGSNLLVRILGLILASLATEMVLTAIVDLLPSMRAA